MKSRIFLHFCLTVKIVKSLHYESVFDTELYKSVLNSDLCDKQIQALPSSPQFLQKFMEANANIPHDLGAKGVLTYTGDYFNCLSIHEHVNGLDVQGKYSQVTIDVPGHINNYEYKKIDNVTWQEMKNSFDRRKSINVSYKIGCKSLSPPDPESWERSFNTSTITLGVCIPEPCSSAQAIDFVLDTEHRPLTLKGIEIQPNYKIQFYRLPSDRPISTADYIFILVLAFVILFGITGTFYDIKNDENLVSTKMMSICRCFAVHKNVQQLLKVDSSSNTVQCVDGIRAIAMAIVIWVHCYSESIDVFSAKYWLSAGILKILLVAGMFGVDTFLLLGGIFNVYSTVFKYKKRPFFRNLHLHLLNRLVRIYPVLCFAVLAQASIMSHIGDGPLWYTKAKYIEICRLNWWTSLLFIQNFIKICNSEGYNSCLAHTWYVAMDIQLFLFSTLVLMWMFGKKRRAWIVLVVAIILSLACSTIINFLFNFQQPILRFEQHPEQNERLDKQYLSILCRSPPYFVGMLTGYVFIYLKDQKQTFHFIKVWIWFLWILATVILMLSIFGMTDLWDSINNQVLHNIMSSITSAIWSIALSWVVIACHLGYGGPVNWFLSLKQWKLLSRLSYAMYILHYPIINWINSVQSGDVIILKTFHLTVFQLFLTAFLASVAIAFTVTVVIEQPLLNLYKTLLGGKKPVAKVATEGEYVKNISFDAVSTLNASIQEEKKIKAWNSKINEAESV